MNSRQQYTMAYELNALWTLLVLVNPRLERGHFVNPKSVPYLLCEQQNCSLETRVFSKISVNESQMANDVRMLVESSGSWLWFCCLDTDIGLTYVGIRILGFEDLETLTLIYLTLWISFLLEQWNIHLLTSIS